MPLFACRNEQHYLTSCDPTCSGRGSHRLLWKLFLFCCLLLFGGLSLVSVDGSSSSLPNTGFLAQASSTVAMRLTSRTELLQTNATGGAQTLSFPSPDTVKPTTSTAESLLTATPIHSQERSPNTTSRSSNSSRSGNDTLPISVLSHQFPTVAHHPLNSTATTPTNDPATRRSSTAECIALQQQQDALSEIPSFFPPDYPHVPPNDKLLPDPTDDFDETVYFSELVWDDLRHQPLAYHFAMESYQGIRATSYTSSGLFINREEREALRAERRRLEQLDECEASLSGTPPRNRTEPLSVLEKDSNNSTNSSQNNLFRRFSDGPVQKSAAVPLDALSTEESTHPDEILEKLIDGHHIEQTFYPDLIPFTDRYFTHHQDLSSIKNEMCDTFIELMHIPDRPPLIVGMYNWMIARFALRCVYYRTNALKSATRKFVLVGTQGDNGAANSFFQYEALGDPKFNVSVFLSNPLLLHWYGVNGHVEHPKFTPTPLGNKMFHRSGQSLRSSWLQEIESNIQQNGYTQLYLKGLDLSLLFPHIKHKLRYGRKGTVWLERALELFAGRTIDPPVEWIPLDQLPERVTTIYIIDFKAEKERNKPRHSLTNEVLLIHNEPGNRAAAAAQHIALLPFPTAMYHKLKQQPYGNPNRKMELLVAFSVWDWRKDLNHYLLHSEVRQYIREPSSNLPQDLYAIMDEPAFVVSPHGFGYDCFRTWESLAFGLIPILRDPVTLVGQHESVMHWGGIDYGHEMQARALRNVYMDLPVIMIEKDTDINLENMTQWRAEVYEKAKRGEYKLEKLFLQYWIDKIYGHLNEEPS